VVHKKATGKPAEATVMSAMIRQEEQTATQPKKARMPFKQYQKSNTPATNRRI
jgi:hypothetical protein